MQRRPRPSPRHTNGPLTARAVVADDKFLGRLDGRHSRQLPDDKAGGCRCGVALAQPQKGSGGFHNARALMRGGSGRRAGGRMCIFGA